MNLVSDSRGRLLTTAIDDHLRVMPAVVLTEARQTGKSTLAAQLTRAPRTSIMLDDVEARGQAQDVPAKLLQLPGVLTIDEVQRVPDVLLAIKGVRSGARCGSATHVLIA